MCVQNEQYVVWAVGVVGAEYLQFPLVFSPLLSSLTLPHLTALLFLPY